MFIIVMSFVCPPLVKTPPPITMLKTFAVKTTAKATRIFIVERRVSGATLNRRTYKGASAQTAIPIVIPAFTVRRTKSVA